MKGIVTIIYVGLIFLSTFFYANAQTPVLLYENLAGTANPGTFGSTNLTMDLLAMRFAVHEKVITSIDINAKFTTSPVEVRLTLKDSGVDQTSALQTINDNSNPAYTTWFKFDFSSSPYLVTNGNNFTLRPTRESGGEGFPFGQSGAPNNWNIRIYGYDPDDIISTSTASSTEIDMGDTNLILTVILFFLSFLTIGLAFSLIKDVRKK